MSDFKQFMEKVRIAILDDGDDDVERVPSAALTLLCAKCGGLEDMDPRDVLSSDELRCCYVAVTSHLLADAAKRGAFDVFTDVLSEKLAQVAFSMGTHAAGDLVRNLGTQLERIGAEHEAGIKEMSANDRVREFGESARCLN